VPGIEDIIALVPVAYWPQIVKWIVRILAVVWLVYGVLWVVDTKDMEDGKIDNPRWHAARVRAYYVLSYFLAIVEFFPVPRLPIIDGLKRMRDLSRDPHVDDGPIEGKR
jgi:hypothetical protein